MYKYEKEIEEDEEPEVIILNPNKHLDLATDKIFEAIKIMDEYVEFHIGLGNLDKTPELKDIITCLNSIGEALDQYDPLMDNIDSMCDKTQELSLQVKDKKNNIKHEILPIQPLEKNLAQMLGCYCKPDKSGRIKHIQGCSEQL